MRSSACGHSPNPDAGFRWPTASRIIACWPRPSRCLPPVAVSQGSLMLAATMLGNGNACGARAASRPPPAPAWSDSLRAGAARCRPVWRAARLELDGHAAGPSGRRSGSRRCGRRARSARRSRRIAWSSAATRAAQAQPVVFQRRDRARAVDLGRREGLPVLRDVVAKPRHEQDCRAHARDLCLIVRLVGRVPPPA